MNCDYFINDNSHPNLVAKGTALLPLFISHSCPQLLYCLSGLCCRGHRHENLFVLRTFGRRENKVNTKSLPQFTIVGKQVDAMTQLMSNFRNDINTKFKYSVNFRIKNTRDIWQKHCHLGFLLESLTKKNRKPPLI